MDYWEILRVVDLLRETQRVNFPWWAQMLSGLMVALVGAFVGAFLAFWFSDKRHKKERLREALGLIQLLQVDCIQSVMEISETLFLARVPGDHDKKELDLKLEKIKNSVNYAQNLHFLIISEFPEYTDESRGLKNITWDLCHKTDTAIRISFAKNRNDIEPKVKEILSEYNKFANYASIYITNFNFKLFNKLTDSWMRKIKTLLYPNHH
ncbi:MAG: hypothetical protein IIC64_09210 [SAR324 cluster bacterium]|nr:hypothetical protein [SAR324 cluster bacterium]